MLQRMVIAREGRGLNEASGLISQDSSLTSPPPPHLAVNPLLPQGAAQQCTEELRSVNLTAANEASP